MTDHGLVLALGFTGGAIALCVALCVCCEDEKTDGDSQDLHPPPSLSSPPSEIELIEVVVVPPVQAPPMARPPPAVGTAAGGLATIVSNLIHFVADFISALVGGH